MSEAKHTLGGGFASRDRALSDGAKAAGSQPESPARTAGAASPVIEELIGSLCGQIEAAEDKAQRWAQELMAARKRANEAERRHAEAIEALRPFARLAEGISDWWDGERRLNTLDVPPIRIHHVRRALALVTVAGADPGSHERLAAGSGTAERLPEPRDAPSSSNPNKA